MIERFAAAPDIVHPIGMAFDGRGRLLVIESHTHFRPENYQGPKHDRIRILEDTHGDGNGTAGGDNVSTLFRLYGDVNGDKAVNGFDLTAFRNAFGSTSADAAYVSFLDFNGDGAINGADLTQFRTRFGVTLP